MAIEKKTSTATLEVGFLVILVIREGAAPLRCYVGQIEAIDERGLRMTLVDWFVGMMTGADFFAPWSVIESAMVYTPQHSSELFLDDASRWQTQMLHPNKDSEEGVRGE